jgi:RNA polymerase sigma-70 factor, ECF subfamily
LANRTAPVSLTIETCIDEAGLLARLHAGEESAFDELVRLAGGRMLAVARRMLSHEDDAGDAVQEAFLSAFKSLDRFDGRSQLTTWLHRITVNACLMKLRSQRRRPEKPLDDLLPQFQNDGHQKNPSRPWKPSNESGIETLDMRTLVRSKIDELPTQFREILLLRDIEELDTEETARLLGLTGAAVKTRLHRARQALRTLLDPYMTEGAL